MMTEGQMFEYRKNKRHYYSMASSSIELDISLNISVSLSSHMDSARQGKLKGLAEKSLS